MVHTVLEVEQKKEETTSSPPPLRTLLQAQLPTFDDAAVNQLVTDCCRQMPNVTVEEISELFGKKLATLPRGVENPNGFLLRAVARSCTQASLAASRRGSKEPERKPPNAVDQSDADREYWQALAANPDATEEMRSAARQQCTSDKRENDRCN